MKTYNSFYDAIKATHQEMREHSRTVLRGKWQGTDVSKRPEMRANEITYWGFKVPLLRGDLEHYQRQIKPNLPWADDHFAERVGGHPLNPGKEWANWPWGDSAGKFRLNPSGVNDPGPDPVFDHTYAQRYWPMYAGRYAGGIIDYPPSDTLNPHRGIYFDYGDLHGVVRELNADPTTRQAILPIFFPEDTGLREGRRKPCSIFYQWQLVDGKLDIVYYLRSCDLVRHFRDDLYLTVRLNFWMLDQLRDFNDYWCSVPAGNYVMLIGNLHCFANDVPALMEGKL